MDNFEDPADLDGDGEFDGIDIEILKDGEEEEKQRSGKGNPGYCLVLLAGGSSISTGWWMVTFL